MKLKGTMFSEKLTIMERKFNKNKNMTRYIKKNIYIYVIIKVIL